jgi:hypothetical protein
MQVEQEAPRCANHPGVETWVSCSSCGKPICPDCMVQSAVGIKCRDCARVPRSARVRIKPSNLAASIGTAIGLGLGIGFVLASVASTAVGFFAFFVAYGVGYGMAEVIKRVSGYYRGPEAGWIAVLGVAVAYISSPLLLPVIYGGHWDTTWLAFDALFGGLAAFVAYRRSL